MAEVIYEKPAARDHYGRNGMFKAAGIHANRFDASPAREGYVVLQGTSTRGWSNAADLVIPIDELDNVIAMLESLR